MTCPNCGAEQATDSIYCLDCGAVLRRTDGLIWKSRWIDGTAATAAGILLMCLLIGILANPILLFVCLKRGYKHLAIGFGIASVLPIVLVLGALCACFVALSSTKA